MNIKRWKIISVVFCLIIGTLLHFTYEWSGENNIVGAFSAVNESTWEHLKLAFFPMLFIAVVGYFFFGKDENNYIKANAIGIIIAISFITIFFYTYTGIIGENYSIVDISIFVISIILGESITYKIINSNNIKCETLYVKIITFLLICFVVFTYFPPKINYFKDPITNTYGISKKGV